MLKPKSDDELEILGKLVKKKQILRNSYLSCPSSFDKAKNDSKTKKTSFSMRRLLKCETVEKNWIEKSVAPFDRKSYDKGTCN